MSAPTAPAPQPEFKTIRKATIPVKTLSKLNERIHAAQAVIARVYELLEHASIEAEKRQAEFMNEAARVLGKTEYKGETVEFKSRHELRQFIQKHKLGIEVDDDTGEIRIYETVQPPAAPAPLPVEAPAPQPQKVERKVCAVCGELVSWSQISQKFRHSTEVQAEAISPEGAISLAQSYGHEAKMKTVTE